MEGSIESYKNQIIVKPINRIKFHYDLRDFRKGQENYSFSSSLEFEFHPNAYDMYSEDIEFRFSKLYDEKITELEMQEIIEQLGTYIYDRIDKII